MTEVRSYPLAPNERVRGGLVLDTSLALYWSDAGAQFVGPGLGAQAVPCAWPLKGIVGARKLGTAGHVLDTLAGGVIEVGPRGCSRLREVHLTGLVAAAPSATGWILVQRLRDSSARLAYLPHPELAVPSGQGATSLPIRDSADIEWSFLAPAGDGRVFFGNHRRPSRWMVLSPEGRPLVRSQEVNELTAPAVLATLGPTGPGQWHALVPLDLGSGIVQMVADLASDRRVLLLFDRNGSFIRSTELVAPIGFFAADRETGRLLGTRVMDRNELVIYSWRWQTG